MENRAKMRERPNFLGRGGEFLQFVPETLEHSLYIFLMTKLPLLSQKLATKLKKLYFQINFTLVPSLLASPSPKLWAKFVILLYLPIRLGVNLN